MSQFLETCTLAFHSLHCSVFKGHAAVWRLVYLTKLFLVCQDLFCCCARSRHQQLVHSIRLLPPCQAYHSPFLRAMHIDIETAFTNGPGWHALWSTTAPLRYRTQRPIQPYILGPAFFFTLMYDISLTNLQQPFFYIMIYNYPFLFPCVHSINFLHIIAISSCIYKKKYV